METQKEKEKVKINIREIADRADLIVCGFAFTQIKNQFHVLNLHQPTRFLTLSSDGNVLETNMDEIETELTLDYYAKNRDYLVEILNT